MGVRGLAPRKFFMTTPFRSLENAPFLDNLLLKDATDHNGWESFQENFETFELYRKIYPGYQTLSKRNQFRFLISFREWYPGYEIYCIFDRFW